MAASQADGSEELNARMHAIKLREPLKTLNLKKLLALFHKLFTLLEFFDPKYFNVDIS